MKLRRRSLAIVFVILAVVAAARCSHNVTPETPRAAAALKADAVVIRINELQATVIQACGPGPECQPNSLPTNLAREIVKGCIDLRTAARSAPDGWQATVKTLWGTVKPRVATAADPVIQAAASALDVVIGGL